LFSDTFLQLHDFDIPIYLALPAVGGTRQRRFAGTNFKPRNLPENAQTPKTVAARCVAARCVGHFHRTQDTPSKKIPHNELDSFLHYLIFGNYQKI